METFYSWYIYGNKSHNTRNTSKHFKMFSPEEKDFKEAVIIIFAAPGLSCGIQTLNCGMRALVP